LISAQVFKQLAGQAHGGCGHADAVCTNLGAAAHLLGHGKAALKELVQCGAQCACGFGSAHRVFHLAQDLRFAQHHRIEPAGHAERVAGNEAVFQSVGVRAQQRGAHAAR
jgi:hypothetical protein